MLFQCGVGERDGRHFFVLRYGKAGEITGSLATAVARGRSRESDDNRSGSMEHPRLIKLSSMTYKAVIHGLKKKCHPRA